MYAASNPSSKSTREIFGVDGGQGEAVETKGGRKGSTVHGAGLRPTPEATDREAWPYCEGSLRIADVLYGSDGEGDVMCVQYSPDGRLLAAGYSSGIIKLFATEDGRHCLHVLAVNNLIQLPVTCVRFLSTGRSDGRRARDDSRLLAAAYASGCVRFWHFSSASCPGVVVDERISQQTTSLAFSSDGHRVFATVGVDPAINLYDSLTKKRIRTFQASDSGDVMDGHRGRLYAVQFHPTEPHVFLTGGWDNTVQFWDDRQPHSVRRIFGPHICGDALDIDPLYGHILTGSWRKDEALQIWDFGSGEKIKDIPQDPRHSCQYYCAQWLGSDDVTCAGSSENMLRVISRATLDTLGALVSLPKAVFCLDNNRVGPNPQLAAGAGTSIYVVQTTVPCMSNK